jgi:hypothetical protein
VLADAVIVAVVPCEGIGVIAVIIAVAFSATLALYAFILKVGLDTLAVPVAPAIGIAGAE